MIVHFDNVNLSSSSGPNSFAQRLKKSLEEKGHKVSDRGGDRCDVSLVFIEPSGSPLAKKVVQRLDGIWFAPNEFEVKNVGIKSLYQKAHHVVWQSEFDKNMTEKWWGKRSGSVIRNGIKVLDVSDKNLQEQIDSLKTKHEKIFVCSANWHPQKRLNSNVDLFKHLKKKYPTACLIVMGSNGFVIEKDVYVTGSLKHDQCLQIFKNCDWMIHLAWLDHCPNTVVEAISCGTPVICSEDGGTRELVRDYGVVLKEKSKYNFELSYYDAPPEIDVTQVEDLPPRHSLGKTVDFSIEESSRRYLEVFSALM